LARHLALVQFAWFNPKPAPKTDGSGSLISISLNDKKELEVNSTPQTGGSVPDDIVYGHLFRSILMFREKAAEEEKQGRQGAGYTKAIQATLKLDDATAKALDDAATAWDNKKDELTAKAEAIMNKAPKEQALTEGGMTPTNPDVELQQVSEQIKDAVLTARDGLRESLSENEFEALQQSVQENVTAHINSKAADPNDPNLVRTSERVSPYKPLLEAPPEAVVDGDRLIVHHDPAGLTPTTVTPEKATPAELQSDAKTVKGVTLNNSKRTGDTVALQQVEPINSEFNFCFFGGIVFYGTFIWLVPSIDRIVQVSFTQLDFCAGLRADPYVYAALQSPFSFDDGESLGRGFIRPAVVENNVLALPSTPYAAYAEHWIFHCFEFCQWIFIDAYTIFFQTPQCVSGSSSGFSANFTTCPGPSPSPTPTPTVKIDSVGFTGDFPLRHWDEDATKRKRIDFPDGTEPTWNRASNPKSAVAYKRGINPTMFATFMVTPAQSIARPAQVRVKKGSTIVATKSTDIGPGRSEVRDITVSFSGLESAALVKRGNYDFTWEVSFDNGSNWQNAGKSGTHKIYWTFDNPLSDIWKNQADVGCFFTADGIECDTLYDEAMQLAAGNAEGKNTVDTVADKVTKKFASQFIYDPCQGDPPDHPLLIAGPKRAQCSANANLLRGILRTIGIDARTNYYWGGNNSTSEVNLYQFAATANMSFRVKRRAQNDGTNIAALMQCPNIDRDPHFQFHALVEVAGKVYDPSYGLTNQDVTKSDTSQVKAIEVSQFPNPGFFLDSAVPADRLVMRNQALFNVIALRRQTGTTCSHSAGVAGLFPNPIDDAEFFVAQHYLDFLNRDADADGLAFWTGGITQCGTNGPCIEDKRVHTTLAFFLSIEYQERGYFVHRFYKSAYGRRPLFNEFLTEMGKISPDFTTPEMENDKTVYGEEFVETQAFKDRYPFTMEFSTFVDTLFANAGVASDPTERANLINGLQAGTETRASVLRKVVDNATFRDAEFRPAFVEMCYFGYLRRDPDEPGFNFWLMSLNNSNGDLYHGAKAFIVSTEYRGRFGQP
jgi:hypothetical protein